MAQRRSATKKARQQSPAGAERRSPGALFGLDKAGGVDNGKPLRIGPATQGTAFPPGLTTAEAGVQGPRGAAIDLTRRVAPMIEENLPALKDTAFKKYIAKNVPGEVLSPFEELKRAGQFSGERTTGSFPMPEDNAWKALAALFMSNK